MTELTLERLFSVLPGLERLAAADRVGAAIERRLTEELHSCAFCPERARMCFVAGPSDLFGSARWLDTCAPHGLALHDLAYQIDNDAEMTARYERWRAGPPAYVLVSAAGTHRHGVDGPAWVEHDHLGGGAPHRHDSETGGQVPVPGE